ANEAQGIAVGAVEHGIDRRAARSGGGEGDVEGAGADDGVGFDAAAARSGSITGGGDDEGGVGAGDLLGSQRRVGQLPAARRQARLVEAGVDGAETFGPFGMTPGLVLEEQLVADEQGHAWGLRLPPRNAKQQTAMSAVALFLPPPLAGEGGWGE